MRLSAGAWAVVLMVGLVPTPAGAQAILARVTDSDSAQPLQGTLVALTDPTGAPVRSALTDTRGQFLFAGIVAGTYTVRAELIGFSTVTQTVTLGAAETRLVEFRMESRAIEIEGISVEGEGRCTLRPEAGLRVAEVWDEIRKALEAARWTSEHGIYEYRTRSYSRDVDEETGLVTNQESRRGRVYLNNPYESRPAEDLLENGFIQERTDGSEGDMYFAPDASVLLADIFLDSHCMNLRVGDGDEAGLVGLAFEPVRGRRIPDIAGTLWVDPVSWRLSHLEYSYENTPPEVLTRGVGGEVAFQLLPNGTWIVPEWRIRMPLLALGRDGRGRETIFQIGHREVGATVSTIREPGGEVIFSASTAALEGVVLEEFTSEPVEGAVVSLAGTEEQVTTDADGGFRFTEVLPGTYDVTAENAGAQDFGLTSPPVRVDLEVGNVASVRLVLNSPFALHEAACREEFDSRPQGSTILVGQVTEGASGVGLEGSRVKIEWDEFGGNEFQILVQGRGIVSTAGPDGSYRACLVPNGTLVRVTAEWGPFTSAVDTIRIPRGVAGLGHDIRIGVGPRTTMVGTVLGWSSGRVVSGAEIRLSPMEGGATPESTVVATDSEGRFTVPEIDVGLHVLQVSSLGYATISDTVEARAGRVNHVAVRLPEEALAIEGVMVEVEARTQLLQRAGYYERRREGLGFHIDADAIEALLPLPVTQIFDRVPGVQVGTLVGQHGHREAVVIRGCLPTLYIDGILMRRGMEFDRNPSPGVMPDYLSDFVTATQIAGIEVFRSPAEAPSQYTGMGNPCAVILVWTR